MQSCPACDSSSWNTKFHIDQWDILECPNCLFAHIDPMPVRDTRPEFYSEENVVARVVKKKRKFPRNLSAFLKKHFNNLIRRNKYQTFQKKLTGYLPRGAKILDVACGDGNLLEGIKNHFDCTGNEISEYLAGLAEKRGGIHVIPGNFFTVDFGEQKFDGITMVSLIEHLDDPEAAMRRCFDLLKEGGVLIQKTVNYECVNQRLMGGKWTGFRPPDHMIYFTPDNLKRLLKKVGFKRFRVSAWPLNDNMYLDAWK